MYLLQLYLGRCSLLSSTVDLLVLPPPAWFGKLDQSFHLNPDVPVQPSNVNSEYPFSLLSNYSTALCLLALPCKCWHLSCLSSLPPVRAAAPAKVRVDGEEPVAGVGEGDQGDQLRLLDPVSRLRSGDKITKIVEKRDSPGYHCTVPDTIAISNIQITIFIWSRPNLNRLKRFATFSPGEPPSSPSSLKPPPMSRRTSCFSK